MKPKSETTSTKETKRKGLKPHQMEQPEKRNPGNKDSFAYRLTYALNLRKLLAIDVTEQTGIGKSTMSLYVNGKSMPSKERVIKLANCLRVDPAWLLGLTPLQAYNRYEDDDPYLDKELEKIRNVYNSLNKEGRKYLLDTVNLLFESHLYTGK